MLLINFDSDRCSGDGDDDGHVDDATMISGGIGVDDDNDGMMPTFIDDQC